MKECRHKNKENGSCKYGYRTTCQFCKRYSGMSFTAIDDTYVTKRLNIGKIKDIEDVKRVLKFLNVKVTLQEGMSVHGYDEVKDLFD